MHEAITLFLSRLNGAMNFERVQKWANHAKREIEP